MKNIHEFDSNLREQIEKFGKDAPVVFIQRDKGGAIRPCSPNKILLSETTNIRPFKRLLPVGFQTGYKTRIAATVQKLDECLISRKSKEPFLMDIETCEQIVDLIDETLMFRNKDFEKNGGQVPGLDLFEDFGLSWDINAFKSLMRYLATTCSNKERQGKIWCLIRTKRKNARIRKDGDSIRFFDAPDTSHVEGKIARESAYDIPMLILFRQEGAKEDGWMDTPFWWPVLYMPETCNISVFANETARDADTPTD